MNELPTSYNMSDLHFNENRFLGSVIANHSGYCFVAIFYQYNGIIYRHEGYNLSVYNWTLLGWQDLPKPLSEAL